MQNTDVSKKIILLKTGTNKIGDKFRPNIS